MKTLKANYQNMLALSTKKHLIRNLFMGMSLMAITFSSCMKNSTSLYPPVKQVSDEVLSTEYTHYYHDHSVNLASEIASYYSDDLAMLITSKIDGHLSCYYFDNIQQEAAFLKQFPQMQEAYNKVELSIQLHDYAVKSGALDYYQKHNEMPSAYTEYLNQYKTRAGYTLWAGLNATGGNVFIGAPTELVFAMDNDPESFTGVNFSGQVFKNHGFVGPSLMIYGAPGFVNFLLPWRNVISSAL